jgi:aspartyl-tRNA(Asn)/glutamyl-tRNA(Gln) amidotransferase subunit A
VTEPCQWGISDAARAIRERRISSTELVDSLLARIDRCEPQVQAWARLDRDQLREEASCCDAEVQRGRWRGPLHGVPVGIKDNFATRGLETCAGSCLLAGNVPQEDADAVSRLRGAGALVLGKTAMTVFAAMDPAPTRNPWNLQHTPGGSSSGSAAAVAARMCAAALGTQTAGSVVRPAAYCGVVGLKPTYGAVSRKGLVPCAWSMDHVGVLARSTDDVAAVFRAIASGASARACANEAGITIGVPDRYFFDAMDAEVGAAFEQAVALLRQAGAEVISLSLPPGFEALVEAGIITMYAEMGAYHRDRFA